MHRGCISCRSHMCLIWPCCCQRRYNLRMSLAAMHLMANCRSSFSIWKCTWELPSRLLPNRRRYHAKSKDRYVVSFQRSALYFWGLRTIRNMRSIQNSFSAGGYPAPVPSSIRQFPCAVINRKYRHGTKHATLHMSQVSALEALIRMSNNFASLSAVVSLTSANKHLRVFRRN